MRKLLSILLLAIVGLPAVTPLFALTAMRGNNLPACCRRGGEHHCMSMANDGLRSGSGATQTTLQSPPSKCPYCPASVASAHSGALGVTPSEAIFAGLVSHPAAFAQMESRWRMARDRSRGKRGPPSHILL